MDHHPAQMSDNEHRVAKSQAIIFYDGVCGLCDRLVSFVFRHDRKGHFLMAPLQGLTARRLLTEEDTGQLKSVVLWQNGRCWRKTAAVSRILFGLGGFWRVIGFLFWIIPYPLRDLLYFAVAKTRYRWFGRKEICRLPSPEEVSRLLE